MEVTSPYQLKRNDIDGALALIRKLKAQGKLTPEIVEVLLKLQDRPEKLEKALERERFK